MDIILVARGEGVSSLLYHDAAVPELDITWGEHVAGFKHVSLLLDVRALILNSMFIRKIQTV